MLLCLLAGSAASAEVFHVGAKRDAKRLADVLTRLKPGDIVEIDAGIYHETAKIAVNGTREKPIVIRGVGGAARPIFDALGLDTSGVGKIPRGVFQIEGAFVVVEHLEFQNARNGQNAAGIRLLDSTNAVIRDCKVRACDMGIFGGDRETVTIENCDIGENGTEKFSGGSHNFYMQGNRVVVRGCFIHDALWGQNFKSRAHFSELWFNHIADSNEGEVGFVDAKGETDRPHSGALVVGNTIISKPNRAGNASKFILFGSELGNDSGGVHDGTLFLFHNTFVAGTPRIHFVTLDDPKASLIARGNVFVGSDQILTLARPAQAVDASGNFLPASAVMPTFWSSPPGVAPLAYIDGDGVRRVVSFVPKLTSPAAVGFD